MDVLVGVIPGHPRGGQIRKPGPPVQGSAPPNWPPRWPAVGGGEKRGDSRPSPEMEGPDCPGLLASSSRLPADGGARGQESSSAGGRRRRGRGGRDPGCTEVHGPGLRSVTPWGTGQGRERGSRPRMRCGGHFSPLQSQTTELNVWWQEAKSTPGARRARRKRRPAPLGSGEGNDGANLLRIEIGLQCARPRAPAPLPGPGSRRCGGCVDVSGEDRTSHSPPLTAAVPDAGKAGKVTEPAAAPRAHRS